MACGGGGGLKEDWAGSILQLKSHSVRSDRADNIQDEVPHCAHLNGFEVK